LPSTALHALARRRHSHGHGTKVRQQLLTSSAGRGIVPGVRIGEPARRHGVHDGDIWHAVRNSTKKIDMDDDLTMLIGPAQDGAPLEIGVLGLGGDDPVVIHAMRLRPKFYPFLGQE
jgi:hypothetical protein